MARHVKVGKYYDFKANPPITYIENVEGVVKVLHKVSEDGDGMRLYRVKNKESGNETVAFADELKEINNA